MDREEAGFAYGLLAVCALGLVLRAVHLDLPLRYDETVTWTGYAAKGWAAITSTYDTPNNHVLHTLLVRASTDLLGPAPMAIRLPAFIAGCLLVPLAAWVAFQAHGRAAALVAATLVATSPVLIEFSTNARGYTLLGLSVLLAVGLGQRLLARGGWVTWVALVEVGVMGFYTVPLMAVPWAGITLWLAAGIVTGEGSRGVRPRRLAALAAVNLAVVAVAAALYSGIVLRHGLRALTGNRFVAGDTFGSFLAGAPEALAAMAAHWARGVPWPLAVAAAAVSVAGVALTWRGFGRAAAGVAVGAALAMVAVRNHGEPRIWLWALPLVMVAAGVGVAELLHRRAPGRGLAAAGAVSAAWALALSATLFLARPVRASLETGAFPDVEEVVEGMAGYFRPGDQVLSDFVSAETLRYYVERYRLGQEADESAGSSVQRNWVVVNRRDVERVERLEERLARMGAPPLEESTPVFSVGMTDVYLFGRPGESPDPRLLEAVDWYTGVAGWVDDGRARALLEEVLDEGDSVLARAWLARCYSRGRMGFEENRELAGALAVSVLPSLRELAETGDTEAVFLLGSAYGEGLGVEVDAERAALLYRTAADGGHVLAAHNLGNAYASGEGVPPDPASAVHWWRQAAEAGDAVTELRLGEAYEGGRGVPRDLDQARAWYARAARRGNAEARSALVRVGG